MAITLPTQYTSLAVRSADAALQVQVDLKSVVDQINAAPAFNQAAVAITGGTINNTPIGGTTPAAGAFTTLTATSYGIIAGVGLGYSAANALTISSIGQLNFGSSGLNSPDSALVRDAANTLAQRNGAAAQTFNVYNTYTDASNYERGIFDWTTTANTLTIGSKAAGTGVVRNLSITGLNATLIGINQVYISTAGSTRWQFNGSGSGNEFGALVDNLYDIGATGSSRPRNIFAGTGFRTNEAANGKQGVATLVAGTLVVANTSITATSRIFLTSNTDGGAPGFLRVSARTAGTSFTITSSSGTDTSIVAYEIFEPS